MTRFNICTGWVGIFAIAVLATNAAAQFDPNVVPFRENTRALITNSWNNMGIQGGNPEINRGGDRNAYPHNGAGPGSFGQVLSQFTSGPKSQVYNDYKTSMGDGLWILTSDGQISLTGPRPSPWIKDFIRPLPYDPRGNEEENWGVINPLRLSDGSANVIASWSGGGSEPWLSNYWPNVTPSDFGSYLANEFDPSSTGPVVIANYKLGEYIVDQTIPEETIITRWVHIKQGIQVTRRVYNWSHPNFDDFYLVDLTFTNTGDFDGDGQEDAPGATATQNDMYFAFVNSWVSAAMGLQEAFGWDGYVTAGNGRGVDDIYYFSDAANYGGAFAPGYKASIFRDSDNPLTPHDDTGDPFFQRLGEIDVLQTEGQLRAPQHIVMAPVAFTDDAGLHAFNDRDRGKYVQPQGDQPVSAQWWQARSKSDFDDPYTENDTEAAMYSAMLKTGIKDNPNESNVDDRKIYIFSQVYGPYTLQAGESAKIVMAFVAGHPAQMKNMDILTWDRSSDPVETKIQEFKTLGEQAAFENLQLAHFIYDANFHHPPAPMNAFISADELTSSGFARQQISWADDADRAVNPYTGTQDIAGYRVYRSTWFGWGPWELHDTVLKGQSGSSVNGNWSLSGGKYTYEDLDTAAGFEYHYSVRPYNGGYGSWMGGGMTLVDLPTGRARTNASSGYESGWGPPTARTYDGDDRRPFQPTTAETDQLDRKVLVVPNPYFVDGKHQYPNSRNLRFVGIPSKCKIHIFSASGDRVYTIDHDNPARGEAAFRQVTYNLAGEIQTGLYYFVVVSETQGSQNKIQRGTFVVIK